MSERTQRRLLFVHAHPDDEASKGSATAARYVDEGAIVTLVTCTGGEAGEVLNPSADDVNPSDMPSVRAAELARAVEAVGFTRTYLLGFHDSGFHEDPAGVPEGAFARLPVDDAAAPLARIIRAERPQVVVTYPEDGGYPHPDHIMVYEVTIRALELAEDGDVDLSACDTVVGDGPGDASARGSGGEAPSSNWGPGGEIGRAAWRVPKIYAATVYPDERVTALHEALLERGLESPFEGWMERRAERGAEPEVDVRIPVADWFERRDSALKAHVTQVDPEGRWFAVPRDLERSIYPYEAYHRLRSDIAADGTEDDLFAGL